MKRIETEIIIDTDPERVWQVLTDFEKHPYWNPFIKSIKGEKTAGSKILVHLQPPGSNGMTFKPVILKFDTNKEFRWKGQLGIKGILDGEHYFILEKVRENQTRFIHGEVFSGILASVMGKMLNKIQEGFYLMNEAIKKEIEKQ